MKIVCFGPGDLPDGVAIAIQTRWPDAQIRLAAGASIPMLDQADAVLVALQYPGAVAAIAASRQESDQLAVVALLDGGESTILRLKALHAGADLLLRVDDDPLALGGQLQALLRRLQAPEAVIEIGALRHDPATAQTEVAGELVRLTPTETRLLAALARRNGAVAPYPALIREVWGAADGVDGSSVRKYAQRLREKLGAAGALIVTIPGVGYRIPRRESARERVTAA